MSEKTKENKNEEPKTKKLPEINVKRKRNNFVTIGFRGGISVRIDPGNTRIKDQEVLKCIADKKLNISWLAFIKNGVHEIVSGKEEKTDKDTGVFTAMNADDAIALVRETFSIPALELMSGDEASKKNRKTVLASIDDQIKEIKEDDEDKDKK